MAGGIEWFRWHHGSVTDPKFQLVARQAESSLCEVLSVWAYLLERASSAGSRGEFGELDTETIDCLFAFPPSQTRTAHILKAMESRRLISNGAVVAWEKRQPRRERDDDKSAGNRKRRQRQRLADIEKEADDILDANGVTTEVTPRHATSRQVTPRVEKSREELSLSSFESTTPIESKTKSLRVAKSDAVTKPTRLADNWFLPKEWGDWALSEFPHWSVDTVRKIAEQFADYWRAKAKDAKRQDWLMTWRNWCRSDITQKAYPLPRANYETAYAREMREKVKTVAPLIAAKEPSAQPPAKANPIEIVEGMARDVTPRIAC